MSGFSLVPVCSSVIASTWVLLFSRRGFFFFEICSFCASRSFDLLLL